ncbi:hypothetical_protein [Candidozyma auris]|uniref:hypothetical_protein n=1 Tax=Candidozyma auris TaxID=498019 RepID=UPI000D264221|nr:hypothetical_protein [[Candida] auris]QEO20849.1 hypothetical_protein [[Candida] auris]GBL48633.1 hypothetical protein CAJCM15448_09070 [[Candida] auris]
MHADEHVNPDVEEHSAIDQASQHRYRVWKKNSPYLYDYVSTNSLLWPSLTVQFFPDLETASSENPKDIQSQLVYQRLLLGTFTLGQGTDVISFWRLPYYRDLNKSVNMDSLNYNSEKQEFELPAVSKNKIRSLQSINHLGDVNKLRYMPQNPDVIASSNNMGNMVVYNRTKHSSIKTLGTENEINEPQLRLINKNRTYSGDIFAFDWNRQREGVIVSGNMDGVINLFDIKSDYKNQDDTSIGARRHYDTSVGINDIEWIPNHDSIFLSADDAGNLKLFDIRLESPDAVAVHNSNVACNSISVNQDSYSIASGHSDGSIGIFDVRTLSENSSVCSFQPHSEAITQVRWHPKFASVLGSSSSDKSVKIHDLGCFERCNGLRFSHEGHMLGVNDFDWSLHEDWMVASVADDNSLHIWTPAQQALRCTV